MTGQVLDWAGQRPRAVLVSVVSLDPNQPYQATMTTSNGHYLFNDLPEGVRLRTRVQLKGHASRVVAGAYQRTVGRAHLQNFGHLEPWAWPDVALALSPYPEVAEVLAASGGVQVRLSEPLDEANRARFAQALRLLPTRDPGASPSDGAQSFALGEGFGPAGGDRLRWPFAWRPDLQATGPATAWPAPMPEGELGASNASAVGWVRWNEAGDEATWVWGVAPPGSDAPGQGHQLALVAGREAVQDAEGFGLGLPGVDPSAAVAPGAFLPWPFYREPDSVAAEVDRPLSQPKPAARRWAWVHRHAWPLKLAQ